MKINWDFKIILSSDRSVAKNKGHHSFIVVIPENEEVSVLKTEHGSVFKIHYMWQHVFYT